VTVLLEAVHFTGFDSHRFTERVQSKEISVEDVSSIQRQMNLIYLVAYSPITTIGEVDFSTFSLKEAELAFEQLYYYQADETLDDSNEEDIAENKMNLITEINRVQHFKNIADSMRSARNRRRFF